MVSGLIVIFYSLIAFNISNIAVQELADQSKTNFFTDELKRNEKEAMKIAYNYSWLGVTSIPILLIGLPLTAHGFVNRFNVKMSLVSGIILLCGYAIWWISAYPFT